MDDPLSETAVPPLANTPPTTTVIANNAGFLVLDDYHVITQPAIHQALAFWLAHLPPNLHLILTSRSAPPLSLPRLRARGQLTELRADDLRFTAAEVAAFLQQVLDISLTPAEIATLEQRTEGWIAGLQLAVLSMPGRKVAVRLHQYRLKFLKRQMYGRAKFDLLRKRVLYQPLPG